MTIARSEMPGLFFCGEDIFNGVQSCVVSGSTIHEQDAAGQAFLHECVCSVLQYHIAQPPSF